MPNQPQFLKKALQFFNITVKKTKGTDNYEVVPAEKDEQGNLKPIKFQSEVQKFFTWWATQCHDDSTTLKNRLERYADLDYMYYNDTIVSGSIELYADETVQYDAQEQSLIVNAPEKKVANYITDLFEKMNINQQTLREIARNLALYGDSFNINSLKDGLGFTDSLVVDVTTIKDRIEFNAVQVKKQMATYHGFQMFVSKQSRLQSLADMLNDVKEKEDVTQMYKSYLFGYQVEDDLFLPPWAVTHFRLFSSKSEFYPFGRPLLINAISPFRQLKASKNLMAMARAAKFPKERFQIKVDENMTEAEVWNAINEAKDEYQNLSYAQGSREDFAVGGQIWIPMGLLEYDLLENKMNLDDIADIELLREDIMTGMGVPSGYLSTNKNGNLFGATGQALLQQYKPFGRRVLQIQTAILRELVQMVKMQFIISGDYDENQDFEILMNFPVIEDSSDRLKNRSDSLVLAKSIIDTLKDTLGINTKLPTKVVQDIFQNYSFLDQSDLDLWLKQIDKENVQLSESERKIVKKAANRITKPLLEKTYFECKKRLNLKEGVLNGYHYMSSRNITDKMNEMTLKLLKMKPKEVEQNTKKKIKD